LYLSYAHRKQRGWKGRPWEESLQAYGSGKVLLDHVASERVPVSLWIAHLTACRPLTTRRMGWAGHVARMGEEGGVHRVLVGKPEGKSPMGRPRHRWEDNIKMDV
jgi:hypothetical protein